MNPKLEEIMIRLGKEFDDHKGEPAVVIEEEVKTEEDERGE